MQFDAGHLTAEGAIEAGRRLSAAFAEKACEGGRCFELIQVRHKKHSVKRLVLFLAAFVLTVLLLAHVDSNAASRAVSTQAKFAGAFVNWGPTGREHTLQTWEKWLKQKPSSVLGVDFYGQTTWEDLSKLSWVPGVWKKLNPARNVV